MVASSIPVNKLFFVYSLSDFIVFFENCFRYSPICKLFRVDLNFLQFYWLTREYLRILSLLRDAWRVYIRERKKRKKRGGKETTKETSGNKKELEGKTKVHVKKGGYFLQGQKVVVDDR